MEIKPHKFKTHCIYVSKQGESITSDQDYCSDKPYALWLMDEENAGFLRYPFPPIVGSKQRSGAK